MTVVKTLTEIKSVLFDSGIRYFSITKTLFENTSFDEYEMEQIFTVNLENFDNDIKSKVLSILSKFKNIKFQLIDHY